MRYFNRRQYGKKSSMLKGARDKYPFRLVRNHSTTPRPEHIDPDVYGNFARFPARDGDEWLFSTAAARDLFLSTYGGTSL